MKPTLALAALAIAAMAHAQVEPDRVIVKVNGKAITGGEYYKRMEVQPGLGSPSSNGGFVQIYPGYLALRWLIEEELLIQLARSQGVEPTPAKVQAEFDYRMKETPEQFQAMTKLGMTEADLKHRVLVDLCEFNLTTKGVTVTDFEVEKYYQDNSARFTLPKRYELRMIRVRGEAAKKPVEDALAAGQKFADVAARLSIDISKLDGGRMGVFPEAGLSPATRTLVVATKKGATTAWIEDKGDFAKFLVEDILEVKLLPLDDSLKKSIRESLMVDRGQARNNVIMMMQEFRKKAVLDFGAYPFADDIKRHFSIGG